MLDFLERVVQYPKKMKAVEGLIKTSMNHIINNFYPLPLETRLLVSEFPPLGVAGIFML